MTNNKSRVLIVDDEKSNITVLWETLKTDYVVQVAKNGNQAIELATTFVPDLILLDIIMPDIDGYAVCKELKSKIETQQIPIIFITSKTDDEEEAEGLRLGAVDYIAKPFKSAIVRARVRTHLEMKAYQDQLENRVAERTRELEIKSKDLEETNIALNVLLNKKEGAQQAFQEKVLRDVQDLILPYLAKMKHDQRETSRDTYIDVIESNLNNFVESFAVKINSSFFNLTPMEIQIANLIREGRATKDIANLTKLAAKTVEWHRYNIRMKLGVKNQKVNLRTHLKSMQK